MVRSEGNRESRRDRKSPSHRGRRKGKGPDQVPGGASTQVKEMLSDMKKAKENNNSDAEANSSGEQAHSNEKRLYNHRNPQRKDNSASWKTSGSMSMPGALHTDLSNSGTQKQEPVFVHQDFLHPPTNVSSKAFGHNPIPGAPRNRLQDVGSEKQEPIWVHRDLLQPGNNAFRGTAASTSVRTDLQHRTNQQTSVPYTWVCVPDSDASEFVVEITDNTGGVYIWEDAFKFFRSTTQFKGQAALVAWCYKLAKDDNSMRSRKGQISQENGEYGTKSVDQLPRNVQRPQGRWEKLRGIGDSQAPSMSTDMRLAGIGQYGDNSNVYNNPYMANPSPQHMGMSPGYEQLQKSYVPSFQPRQSQYQSITIPPLYTLQSPLKIRQAQGLGLCLDVPRQEPVYMDGDFSHLSSMGNQNFARGTQQPPHGPHEKQFSASSYATPGNPTPGTSGPKRPGHRRPRAGFYRKKGIEGAVTGNKKSVNVPLEDGRLTAPTRRATELKQQAPEKQGSVSEQHEFFAVDSEKEVGKEEKIPLLLKSDEVENESSRREANAKQQEVVEVGGGKKGGSVDETTPLLPKSRDAENERRRREEIVEEQQLWQAMASGY